VKLGVGAFILRLWAGVVAIPLSLSIGLIVALIYAGVSSLRNSLWAMLLLPPVVMVMQREVIGREERYLERAFGEEYLAYKAQVRRWV
jgi:protein-S-isoprenylcysteine O-methyltransferase Ste14